MEACLNLFGETQTHSNPIKILNLTGASLDHFLNHILSLSITTSSVSLSRVSYSLSL